ncbi:HK97 family phage prohead protease [Flavobacterium sp. TR2]|uniref:HK97 family phage prohead protease n=1 Tax=Flavobacterium sp. TR2 TaxID=2977321 RepID=UPI0021B0AD11|nr:HK97 family phage prohead protease [Flavobacterium sp. TR2]UWY28811.1 HK97 family phage prohead protease [Flavobacterium sp. TR2]
MPKPFVFNDQNQVNSYGFRIVTSGISLKRFKKNPMMLNNHWNSTGNVLGRWENVTVDKDLLLGEPVFDMDDKDAALVAGKVEREFIKTCSMGISFNREDLQIIGDELIMTKCELYECSIVAVPSNANSIRLYNQEGELLKDEEVKKLCLSIMPTEGETIPPTQTRTLDLNPKNNMKKITLSIAALTALSFDKTAPEVDVEAVETAVLKLSKENAENKGKLLAMQTEKENQEAEELKALLDAGQLAGKFAAPKREEFEALGKASLSILKTTLDSIPSKTTLANQTVTPVSIGVATKEDFQKLSLNEQLAFKNSNPDEYNKMFNVKK